MIWVHIFLWTVGLTLAGALMEYLVRKIKLAIAIFNEEMKK